MHNNYETRREKINFSDKFFLGTYIIRECFVKCKKATHVIPVIIFSHLSV